MFLWRGPVRAVSGSVDFALVYGATAAWVAGQNPYEAAPVRSSLRAAGYPRAEGPRPVQLTSVYPPSVFLLLSPLAAVSWPAAKVGWCLVNVLAAGGLVWALVRWLGWRWRELRALGLAAAVVAWAPLHTGIALGQTALVPVLLLIVGLLLLDRLRPTAGGMVMAVGMCLKPQLTLPFLLYLVYRRHGRAFLAACVTGLGILALASVPLLWQGIAWPTALLDNVAALRGSIADASPDGPYWFQMIHVGMLWYAVTESDQAVMALSWATAGGLLLIAGWFGWRLEPGESSRSDLALLSVLAVASLLATYHRFYDAVLLVIPLAWTIDQLASRQHRLTAGLGGAAMAVYFVPGAAALFVLANRGLIPTWLTESSLWRWLVMPHQVWALLILAGCLLTCLGQRIRRSPTPARAQARRSG
jgi:hypothetical protein